MMNNSDIFNVVLWSAGVAIFAIAHIRGRDGKVCLETLYTGITALALYGAIDCAMRGKAFMGAVVGFVGLASGITAFQMYSSRKARENAPAKPT